MSKIGADAHVRDRALRVAPFSDWESLEENEATPIQQFLSDLLQLLGETRKRIVILCYSVNARDRFEEDQVPLKSLREACLVR